MRQLAEWEKKKSELEKLDCTIYAISVDTMDGAQKAANEGLTFPIAYGCTKQDGDAVGIWWGNHPPDGEHTQPAEFLLGRGGVVLGSMYASGPIGRIGVDEAIRQIISREQRRLDQEKEARSQN